MGIVNGLFQALKILSEINYPMGLSDQEKFNEVLLALRHARISCDGKDNITPIIS
jgi:hypothetical protein